MVQEVGRRCAEQKIATVDLDTTIIESYKREAQPTYQGGSGYQPMLALWAEMNLVAPDERVYKGLCKRSPRYLKESEWTNIKPELVDELLKGYQKPEDIIGENGLLKRLTKALLERAMNAELTNHLGYEKHDPVGHNSGNSRNGTSSKTVKGEFGEYCGGDTA